MPETPAPLLARLLFPRLQPHLQRRQLRILWVAILVGAFIAAAFGAALYYLANSGQLR